MIRRIKETHEETKCQVIVLGKATEEFWTNKGVREGCPLSQTLFAIYIADIEGILQAGQAEGVVIKKKDDLDLSIRGRHCSTIKGRCGIKEND